jgi:protein AATF/BFR2
LADYQERTIDKWNQKTRLASGRASKGFKALDKSVLQQIKEALAQPSRLVQRTQIKRFEDSIVGYEPEAQVSV